MTLLEQITADYKEAFKNKETDKKTILNMVLAAAKNKKIDLWREVNDEELLSIIKKELKSLKEAADFMSKAGKLADEEEARIAVLQVYLPEMMSEEETKKVVEEFVEKLGIADVNKERWKLMAAIMSEYKGEIDGGVVNKVLSRR